MTAELDVNFLETARNGVVIWNAIEVFADLDCKTSRVSSKNLYEDFFGPFGFQENRSRFESRAIY